MEITNIVAKIMICNQNELTEEQKSVVEAAKIATLGSYAPYSHFNVGAGVLLDNGEIVKGSNQENAAYPSGTCAERTALFYAGANFPQAKVKKIAIIASHNGDFTKKVCSPCGACRQVMLESQYRAGEPIEVLLCSKDEIYIFDSVDALLPLGFDYSDLNA